MTSFTGKTTSPSPSPNNSAVHCLAEGAFRIRNDAGERRLGGIGVAPNLAPILQDLDLVFARGCLHGLRRPFPGGAGLAVAVHVPPLSDWHPVPRHAVRVKVSDVVGDGLLLFALFADEISSVIA